MKTSDNEDYLLEQFRLLDNSEIFILGNIFRCKRLLLSLRNYFRRKKWINSSAKNAPPPDFYNDKTKMMMEVMKIDDHAFIDSRGKIQNPTAKKEKELLKSYFGKDYKTDRNDLSCYVVASSGLPTKEDHDYQKYFTNFQRVFENHNSKIPKYKENHPGYKIIFFVYDESSAYCECINSKDASLMPEIGRVIKVNPHYPFFDRKFMDIIIKSNVDYVIWFMPWKLIRMTYKRNLSFPKCAIIEKGNIVEKKLIDYKENLMVSAEV